MNLYESIVKEATLHESEGNYYDVVVDFCGMNADNEYHVYAQNKTDAVLHALDEPGSEAEQDLSVENIEDNGDGSYSVSVGFAGFIGVENEYTVYADSEEDAEIQAIEQAKDDLSIVSVDGEEFDYSDDSNFNETQKLIESTKKLIKKGERGDEPVALINWEGNYQPYVVAINYDENTGSWGYGYYYTDEELANKAFEFVCNGGNMHDFNPDEEVEETILESEEMVPTIKVVESVEDFDAVEFEKNIPHNMRFKTFDIVNDGKDIYWVTQAPFTKEELEQFQRAFKNITNFENAYVTLRDLSGYDYFHDKGTEVLAHVTRDGYDAGDYINAMIKNWPDFDFEGEPYKSKFESNCKDKEKPKKELKETDFTIPENNSDGWGDDLYDFCSDFFDRVDRLDYELRNAMRGSYAGFGDTIEDLVDELREISADADILAEDISKAEVNYSSEDSEEE